MLYLCRLTCCNYSEELVRNGENLIQNFVRVGRPTIPNFCLEKRLQKTTAKNNNQRTFPYLVRS